MEYMVRGAVGAPASDRTGMDHGSKGPETEGSPGLLASFWSNLHWDCPESSDNLEQRLLHRAAPSEDTASLAPSAVAIGSTRTSPINLRSLSPVPDQAQVQTQIDLRWLFLHCLPVQSSKLWPSGSGSSSPESSALEGFIRRHHHRRLVEILVLVLLRRLLGPHLAGARDFPCPNQ